MKSRHIFKFIFACVLILLIASSTFGYVGNGSINADYLNVREKPSIKSRVIWKAMKGDVIFIEKQQRDKTGRLWYYGECGDGLETRIGWVAAEYVLLHNK